MAENSKISWTHHTFNGWVGCQHWSEECDHCYADTWAQRYGHDVFGGRSKRRRTSKSLWAKPAKWNREAAEERSPRRVFCMSLADMFEDAPGPNEWRPEVWEMIRACPWLDWQLLTKRPENIAEMLPEDWGEGWPNVWLGTSIGNRKYVERARVLAAVPAFNRFISYEPALGPVFPLAITAGLPGHHDGRSVWSFDPLEVDDDPGLDLEGIDWVICGGESGPGHRPMDLDWARTARNRCAAGGPVAFFFKQIGAYKNEQGEDALGRVIHEFPDTWDRADVDTHPAFVPEGSLL